MLLPNIYNFEYVNYMTTHFLSIFCLYCMQDKAKILCRLVKFGAKKKKSDTTQPEAGLVLVVEVCICYGCVLLTQICVSCMMVALSQVFLVSFDKTTNCHRTSVKHTLLDTVYCLSSF